MSFLLDPPLLVAGGAVVERLAPDERGARIAGVATVGTFVGVSAALYANAPGLERIWRPFGSRSGREFMLGSGLVAVRDRRMSSRQHLVALSGFLLYPLWFWLGRRAFRRRPT